MNNLNEKTKKEYFPIDQFSLDRDFLKNPLMSGIKLARFKFVAKLLSKEDTVLDLGCGNGYSSYFFSKFCKKVTGVDLYANIPAVSKKMAAENLTFIKADILSPPAIISNYGTTVVTAIDVIEHFHKKDGEKIVGIYSKILSAHGMMIIGTPNKFSEMYRSRQSKDIHFYEYRPDELKELCNKYFNRTILFSMNDELVHTGFYKLAWFIFVCCFK